jgi:hypothetical protein
MQSTDYPAGTKARKASKMATLENPLCFPISTPALDAGLTSATVLNYIMVHDEVWTGTPWCWVVRLRCTI